MIYRFLRRLGSLRNQYVIAFDLGTSSMKSIIMDETSTIIATETKVIRPYFPKDGWAESDPRKWWDTACNLSREMIKKSGISPLDIKAVSFDAPACGIIPVNQEKGNLYPSMIWLDNRAAGVAQALMKAAGEGMDAYDEEDDMVVLTGKDSIPKLIWMKEYLPNIWDEMDCFLDDVGYLVYCATGKYTCAAQSACTICYDYENKDWDYETLDMLELERKKFPLIVQASEIIGGLTAQAATELGLKKGTPVVGSFTDINAVELGAGCTAPGDVAVYIGTSTIITVTAEPGFESNKYSTRLLSANPEYEILFSTNDTSGGCIDWMIDKLFEAEKSVMPMNDVYKVINNMLSKTKPGAENLFFTPWMCGERNPINNEYIRSGFLNLSFNHGREHMVRALYEGIAYQLRWSFEALESKYGKSIPHLRIAGGGTRSDVLMQIIANVTGKSIDVLKDATMSVSKGAAILAFNALGTISFEDARNISISHSFKPQDQYSDVYKQGFEHFKNIYRSLRKLYFEIQKESYQNK